MGAKKGKDEMLMASAPDQEPGYGSLDGTSREDYAHMTRHEMLLHTRRRLLIAATLCFVVMIAEITGTQINQSIKNTKNEQLFSVMCAGSEVGLMSPY